MKNNERRILFLMNPISGTREKSAIKKTISDRTRERKIWFEFVATNPSGDYSFISDRIQKEGITDVVVCGGDGTISSVAGSLLNQPVNFGIVPLGSGNGLALTAKIPRSVSKALDVVFDGKASRVDGFYVNNMFSCMLCGIGFDAQVAHDFAKSKTRGLQSYIKISAINFFKARAMPFVIESDNSIIETDAFFISIANSNQFGNNFTIAPQASLIDGLLDIVIVRKMNKLMLPFSIVGQITGINALQKLEDFIQRKNIMYFQTKSLLIRNPELAPLHIDGDPKASSEQFSITVKPKAFPLLQPSPTPH